MPGPEASAAIQALAGKMKLDDQTLGMLYQLAGMAEAGTADRGTLDLLKGYGIPVIPAPNAPWGDTGGGQGLPKGVPSGFIPTGTTPIRDPFTGEVTGYAPTYGPTKPEAEKTTYGNPVWDPNLGKYVQTDSSGKISTFAPATQPAAQPPQITYNQPVWDPNLGQYVQQSSAGKVDTIGSSKSMTDYQAAQVALDQAKLIASQPYRPPQVTTNTDNPNEDSQRREWMRLRIQKGEDPYDFGAFSSFMSQIGAPTPSYEGFLQSGQYEQQYQANQQQVQATQAAFDQQTALQTQSGQQNLDYLSQSGAQNLDYLKQSQVLTPYQSGQLQQGQEGLQQNWAQLGQNQQGLVLGAAQAQDPIAYQMYLRGGTPPTGVGQDVMQGFPRLSPGADLGSGAIPSVAAASGGSSVTPEMLARIRQGLSVAGWPGGSDQEAIAAYLKTAKPDDFYSQVQAAHSGSGSGSSWQAPPMSPTLSSIQSGQPVSPWSIPGVKIPGVQDWSNMAPSEQKNFLTSYQYAGVNPNDLAGAIDKVGASTGAGWPTSNPWQPPR